eukprot:TRINITY_DN63452_c0_g1_i1.p1 TRINITY_DN63452_c0_g1~~TRINITY_DN63452_c0_g1_i1.p1  ORF type:complete len:235 (-),score=39.17 TRINITY_DN63452_c0_g1_i1:58-762(-)
MVFNFTELCKFHLQGQCKRGASCTFAHSKDRLKSKPDFTRTRLGDAYEKSGGCRYGNNCLFAHGVAELRQQQTPGLRHIEEPAMSAISEQLQNLAAVIQQNEVLKTRLLQHHLACHQRELAAPQLRQGHGQTPGTFDACWEKLSQFSEGQDGEDEGLEHAATPASSLPAFSHYPSESSTSSGPRFEGPGEHCFFQGRTDFWQGHSIFVKNTFIEPLRNAGPSLRKSKSLPAVNF